ncbi:RusA family crossover junction endodeoxyribonuclease [Mesorhizobium sp. M0276]|uniref:RusA family crossover junction endodeoxyribonuclease n=1 Tax=Mesorhizobium sp. M0276 TaxID=2956928 RepID=UPI00333A3E64
MWPELPLEFNVIGTPVSFQSDNSKAKGEWKSKVLAAAMAAIEGGSWAFDETRLAVTMFYFPQSPMPGDLDNIVKLTLDALQPNLYLDDELIDRILAQRFDPAGSFTFAAPSNVLVSAMALEEPVLYIRVAEVPLEDVAP